MQRDKQLDKQLLLTVVLLWAAVGLIAYKGLLRSDPHLTLMREDWRCVEYMPATTECAVYERRDKPHDADQGYRR